MESDDLVVEADHALLPINISLKEAITATLPTSSDGIDTQSIIKSESESEIDTEASFNNDGNMDSPSNNLPNNKGERERNRGITRQRCKRPSM